MTENRDELAEKLKQKEVEYDELMDKFEKKSMEFIHERQAHRLQIEANQRLEEEIKDLKRQIADLLQQIEGLNAQISDLNQINDQHEVKHEELGTEIEKLKERLRNKRDRSHVEFQVGPSFFKNKEKETQTDEFPTMPDMNMMS